MSVSQNPTTNNENRIPKYPWDVSPLHSASNLADMIRKKVQEAQTSPEIVEASMSDTEPALYNPSSLPGLKQGVTVGLFFAVMLLPPCRLVARWGYKNGFGMFPDLIVTSNQLALSGYFAVHSLSVYGSKEWMTQLAHVPTDKPSALVDGICQDGYVKILLKRERKLGRFDLLHELSDDHWDPRVQTLHNYYLALQQCEKRNENAKLEKEAASSSGKGGLSWFGYR